MIRNISRRDLLTTVIGAAGTVVFCSDNMLEARGSNTEELPKLPRAFRPNDMVLFQGDSITDGGRWYQGMDYNHIMGQDYCYIVAGKLLSDYPSANMTFINRGVGGNTIDNLASRWQSDTLDLKPNFLSILVGINDSNFSYGKLSPAELETQFFSKYDSLIQQTITSLPEVRIVVGQSFVLPVGGMVNDYESRRAQVKAVQDATEAIAKKYTLPLVRYGDMMDDACKRASADHWSWDGIHPTYAGHYLMHDLWIETVTRFYEKS